MNLLMILLRRLQMLFVSECKLTLYLHDVFICSISDMLHQSEFFSISKVQVILYLNSCRISLKRIVISVLLGCVLAELLCCTKRLLSTCEVLSIQIRLQFLHGIEYTKLFSKRGFYLGKSFLYLVIFYQSDSSFAIGTFLSLTLIELFCLSDLGIITF